MIIEELKKIKSSNKIASFYTNKSNTSKFIVGYIVEFNNEYVLISTVGTNGLNNGLLLKEINSIFCINTNSKYLNKIQMLFTYFNQTKDELLIENKNLVLELLKFAHEKNYVVSLELLNSGYDDIIGYVHTIENEGCLIKQITVDGEFNGESIISYSDISQISCNSDGEKIPGILFSLNKNQDYQKATLSIVDGHAEKG